jgi:hypothetical protein
MKHFIFILLASTIICTVNAQVGINSDESDPHPSAMLDVKSDSRGMLPPRLSTLQRTGINNPAPGLIVFDTETHSFWFFNGLNWNELIGGHDCADGEVLQYNGSEWVCASTSGNSAMLSEDLDANGFNILNLSQINSKTLTTLTIDPVTQYISSAGGAGAQNNIYQLLTPSLSGQLHSVLYFLSPEFPLFNATMNIYLGTDINGTAIATQNDITLLSSGIVTILFDNPPTLTAGQEYTFQLVSPYVFSTAAVFNDTDNNGQYSFDNVYFLC